MSFFSINSIRKVLLNDLWAHIKPYRQQMPVWQRGHEYLEWIGGNLVDLVEKFSQEQKLLDSHFVRGMNQIFKTERFIPLTKRWISEYMVALLDILDYYSSLPGKEISLADNPMNRFIVAEYQKKFGKLLNIHWKKGQWRILCWLNLMASAVIAIFLSLNHGLKVGGQRRSFKVMREAVWKLRGSKRFYHKSDFMVDGEVIGKDDLLLFSRGVPTEPARLNAYHELKDSGYQYFNLKRLSLSVGVLFRRIFSIYVGGASNVLAQEIQSPNFSLFSSIYLYFISFGIPYEKVFSHFKVTSELGHNYFSANHIAESIVCQNHGAKYYLMHWSDNSINIDRHLLAFLGCDKFLLWGSAHIQGGEGGEVLDSFGYLFKGFVQDVKKHRDETLKDMGIPFGKKVASFFDESFGGECKILQEDYVEFWGIIKSFSESNPQTVVIVKPKDMKRVNNLSIHCRAEYEEIRKQIDLLKNVHVLDETRWSYIQAIGVADVVLTLSMTSSATIALICGVPGFYFDRDRFIHPFAQHLKNKIVFDDSQKLIDAMTKTCQGTYNPSSFIPEFVMRSFDACSDDSALRRLRLLLAGENVPEILKTPAHWNVGIVVQARMGSTRLPGKIMMPLSGVPVLAQVIRRLRDCRELWRVIVATTDKEQDAPVADLARSVGADFYRGSEEDVLKRYYETANAYQLDVVVRITSDCPLIDPQIIDEMILRFKRENSGGGRCDYLSNTLKRTYPRGLDVEVFSFQALKQAYEQAQEPHQREHVTPFIYQNPEVFKVSHFVDARDYSHLRWTLDEQADYDLLQNIYEILYPGNHHFRYGDVLRLIEERPQLILINEHIQQKAAGAYGQ
jgi:spore coat polysaccharide biosynthesis protein SpsF